MHNVEKSKKIQVKKAFIFFNNFFKTVNIILI